MVYRRKGSRRYSFQGRIVDQVNQLAPGGSWKALLPSRAGA